MKDFVSFGIYCQSMFYMSSRHFFVCFLRIIIIIIVTYLNDLNFNKKSSIYLFIWFIIFVPFEVRGELFLSVWRLKHNFLYDFLTVAALASRFNWNTSKHASMVYSCSLKVITRSIQYQFEIEVIEICDVLFYRKTSLTCTSIFIK